jgi:oligo-1,6-glucosidase
MGRIWWKESVGYQIYVKSFKDGNNDGIGDLPGMTEKLDHLSRLGVNLVWIGPFYDSPMDDNGYDVRDFRRIDPTYGTIDDLRRLVDKAHSLGIRVIFDLVLNHTSDEHPWFKESRSSSDNPKHDFYIWHEGRVKDGIRREPTNWGSFFGGSCWTYDASRDAYYMHIFSKKMPDLNWANPDVRAHMADIARWWLDFGADGFRIDAVSHLDRAPFEDIPTEEAGPVLDWHRFSNLPKVHDYLKELAKDVFIPSGCLTIGEVGGEAGIAEGLRYAMPSSGELSMVFNFDHNWCVKREDADNPEQTVTDVGCLRRAFMRWAEAFAGDGWLPLNWLNHDQPRLMSHYGSPVYPERSAKMLATLTHMMRGTPFIYQGEEIGMTNPPFKKTSDFRDISTFSHIESLKKTMPDASHEKRVRIAALTSRDNPRTPMQWNDGPYAGFSDHEPWIGVHPEYPTLNVEAQRDDPDSVLSHYRTLIALRLHSRFKDVILDGTITYIDIDDPDMINYVRNDGNKKLLCLNVMHDVTRTYDLSGYDILDILVHNAGTPDIKHHTLTLKPFESVVFEVKEKS